MKNISVAHSPDADDIFMYQAINFGWVNSDLLRFNSIALDIQTLNEFALKGEYDVTAISFALYPLIANEQALLRCAVSFGEGYGPKIIKKKGVNLKKNFKVALSGKNTTNALLFKVAYPNARPVYMNFMKIQQAVLNGEVDAGVLIHEDILKLDDEIQVEREMWDIWCELTKDNLPLPLGGMCIRRSIPLTDALEIEKTLTKAVKIATLHKPFLSHMIMERNLVRVNKDELKKYLSMYANERSVSLDEISIKALNYLFKIGYDNKEYSMAIDVNDYLLPTEYSELRQS